MPYPTSTQALLPSPSSTTPLSFIVPNTHCRKLEVHSNTSLLNPTQPILLRRTPLIAINDIANKPIPDNILQDSPPSLSTTLTNLVDALITLSRPLTNNICQWILSLDKWMPVSDAGHKHSATFAYIIASLDGQSIVKGDGIVPGLLSHMQSFQAEATGMLYAGIAAWLL